MARGRPVGFLYSLTIFTAGCVFGVLLFQLYLGSEPRRVSSLILQGTRFENERIPSIVHFIQLKKSPDSKIHFSFEDFLSLYSAFRALPSSIIYIHTDFTDDEITHAIEHGSSWTKRLLTSFPDAVRLNRITAPTEADHVAINRVEHKSDFVRLDVLAHFGGIYLDWDALMLRSPLPLLNAGFTSVVGRQSDDTIMNGILMAAKDSPLLRIMREESPKVFDGDWITHSVKLITAVATAIAAVPGSVLIMDDNAFSPFSWEQESVNALLARHEGDAAAAVGAEPGMDAASVWTASRSRADKRRSWEYDFSDVYFLHKYFNDVENPHGYNGVSVPYVLARDSNYAVAAWLIVMQGIEEGYIDEHDASL